MKKLITTLFILILSAVLIAQTTEWYYDYDLGTSTEEGKDIVFGSDGNIYVVGTADGDQLNYNIIVVSLSQDGTERWTYTYDSPVTNSTDGANKIYYGNDDRIYVAGYNSDSQDADKFFVLCLDNAGNYIWEYQFLDVPGTYGQAFDVVSGDDGNIYVCGKVDYDFFVVSINSTGQQNWIYRLNGDCGFAFCDDSAEQLVYGEDGNIYIAGYVYNDAPTGKDLLVVSLTTTGQENWKYFYNSVDNGGDDGRDIVYGSDGNLYIVGIEGNQGHYEHDILVLSLLPSGSERWTFMYDGPGEKPYWSEVPYEMIQGFDGNLYIAARDGGINTDLDVCVFSVTDEGEFRWVNRYAGVYGDYDMPFSLTQTPDGNIHAAGYFCGLIAEVGMLSTQSETGRRLWAYRYIGESISMDAAYGITSDPSGYVYLTGYDNESNNNNKLFVIKLNPPRNSDGWYNYQRIIKIGYDKYHSESEGSSFEKISDGNYVVTGHMGATSPSSTRDVFLMKIDEACDTFWTKRIGGSDEEKGYSVIETSDGGFAVAGYTRSYGAGGRDVYLIKTDSIGQLEWEKWYGGAADDEGNALVQTADEGYIIAGGNQGDIWLIRTDSGGDTLWTRLLGGEKPDAANKLIKTSDGNFVFTGSYGVPDGAGYVPYWYLVKFNIDGDTLWTKKYEFSYGRGYDLVEVENGNMITVGYMYSYPTYSIPAFLMKVNNMGDTLWTKSYDVNTPYGLMAIDKTDDNGFMILPGEINSMWGAIEALKIDENGNVVFIDTIGYNEGINATCYSGANDILSIGENDYMTLGSGKIQNNNFWNLLIARKGGHLTVLTDVEEDEEITFSQPTDYQLFQNYPNPFNPITTIRYSIPQAGNVKLVIYDILGRKVRTLIDEFKSTGTYETSFDASSLASGVYSYQLRAGNFIQTKKMLMIK